jgi:hypothetical protein
MQADHDVKVRGVLGGTENDDETKTILNRTLTWRRIADRITYEADEKHAMNVIRKTGMDESSRGLEARLRSKKQLKGQSTMNLSSSAWLKRGDFVAWQL